jgi:hypothetical protein
MKATAERYTFVQGGSRGADHFSLPLNRRIPRKSSSVTLGKTCDMK